MPDIMRAALAGEQVRVRNPNSIRPWQHVLNPLSGYLVLAQALWDSPELRGGLELRARRRGRPPGRLDRASASRELWPGELRWVHRRRSPSARGALPEARLLARPARASAGVRGLDLDATLESIVDWYRELRAGGGHARGDAGADRGASNTLPAPP